jgi:hypothetical protein
MVAEEVFVNCYNFNPIRVKHAPIQVKIVLTLRLKRKFSMYLIKQSGAGAGAAIRICGSVEPEQKEIISAPNHCIKQFYY